MSKKRSLVNRQNRKFYFPSLDGLRFFAFFIVFLHHSLFIQNPNPLINFFVVTIIKNGWVGVDLFFVLSGFLITNILLLERKRFKGFSLKNFWIRRALRIWPLYYLALLSGFFIIPYFYQFFFNVSFSDPKYIYQLQTQLPFYLTFLGNWAVVFNGYSAFSNIGHLWTISLEEQFYFAWPLILIFVTSLRKSLIVGFIILILSLVVRTYLVFNNVQHPGIYTNTFARVDILVLGGILALINFYNPKLIIRLKFLFNLPLQIISLIIFILILHRISVFDTSIPRNVIFGFLIIGGFMVYYTSSALQIKSQFAKFLSFRPFVYFGKISYGLYIWHILAIELTSQFMTYVRYKFLFVPFAFLLTVILGYISYRFYESKFLMLKSKFTKIKSRPV